MKNLKEISKSCFFIALKKRPNALKAMQKKPNSLQSTVTEKIMNNPQKLQFMTKIVENGNFWRYF